MAEEPNGAARGCFSRLAMLFGLFWLVAIGIAFFTQIDAGGSGFEITGSFLPIFIFFTILGLARRRVNQTKQTGDKRRAPGRPTAPPSPSKTPSTPPIIPGRPTPPIEAAPAPRPPTFPLSQPSPQRVEPIRPVVPDPGLAGTDAEQRDLEALEKLELGDFEAPKPMSSEERLRAAREKYLKRD